MTGFHPVLIQGAAGGLTVSLDIPRTEGGTGTLHGIGHGGTSITETTDVVTAHVSGYDLPLATKPITYTWTVTPDDGSGEIYAVNPNSASTAFRADLMKRGEVRTAHAVCEADQVASGKSGQSISLRVRISRFS